MDLLLHSKRVLVSGSTRGIGLAIAEAFLAEGAQVIITGRNREGLDRAQQKLTRQFPSAGVLGWACDFTDNTAVEGLRVKVAAAWQGLDVLVVNVGNGKGVSDPLPPDSHFEAVLQLNLAAAVRTAREFYPLLRASHGNIIFIASIAGIEAIGAPVAYAAAKSALIALTNNVARKLGPEGVRVNCIAPGNIYCDGGSWAEKIQENPDAIQAMLDRAVPLRRFGRPEEVAAAVVFLASERSSFTTGACFVIDGGQTLSI